MSSELSFDVAAILREVKTGNPQALNPVLEAMLPTLRKLTWRRIPPYLRTRMSHSDLVQDGYTLALQNLQAFRGHTEEELFSWMTTILKRAALESITYHLAEKRNPRRELALFGEEGPLEVVDEHQPPPDDAVERRDTARLVHEVIHRLPEDQQRVLFLSMERKDMGEVARELGISNAAAYKRVERALAALHEEITKEDSLLPPPTIR